MEEPLAAQLEWWGNPNLCLTFGVLVTVEESNSELTAHGALAEQVLADPEAVEVWEMLVEGSPYFHLVFEECSVFEVVVARTGVVGGFSLTEHVLKSRL
ncbi:hypothetical protein SAMN05216298_2238 [Glycomyces sambucus]|uniref:Uncharacterized protein n=1 Tax=Glycomyces sambucus TaxID=380244 RepID=A0A1G9GJ37_9ACTN|nr:hypothetical protein [Glycomyces sambucus]SDL00687.1 hypothetical protein SAMN05216298_2238 [Glycomyces sambucus]